MAAESEAYRWQVRQAASDADTPIWVGRVVSGDEMIAPDRIARRVEVSTAAAAGLRLIDLVTPSRRSVETHPNERHACKMCHLPIPGREVVEGELTEVGVTAGAGQHTHQIDGRREKVS